MQGACERERTLAIAVNPTMFGIIDPESTAGADKQVQGDNRVMATHPVCSFRDGFLSMGQRWRADYMEFVESSLKTSLTS